jgi:hypothetical protein
MVSFKGNVSPYLLYLLVHRLHTIFVNGAPSLYGQRYVFCYHLYAFIIEVKLSRNTSMEEKGGEDVYLLLIHDLGTR